MKKALIILAVVAVVLVLMTVGIRNNLVTLDEDVQPVSGEREETQVPSGRVVRRAPSDRAARVTFGDDDAIAQVAASEADMPPRRSVGSTRSPRDAATRPATRSAT